MSNYTCIIHRENINHYPLELNENYLIHDQYITVIKHEQIKDEDLEHVYNDENILIIFHGTIYNEKELIHKITNEPNDEKFYSTVELIKELFSNEREKLFQYLRGKFSIIIWDKERHTLYGGRDHFGIKDLFYTETDDSFIISSTKKGVTSFIENDEVSLESLQHYLSFQYVPEPMTMTKNIKKIEPGHYFIKKKDENLKIEQYWRATFKPIFRDKQEWTEMIRGALYESVRVHTEGHKEVGAFLSGGIDSTIIASMAKESYPKLKTFSVGFAREGFSEVDIAKKTAHKLGVENISYVISPEEYVEKLPEIIWNLDDPLADPSCVPLYFVAREAKKHVDTVLSGEGADELFGGYNIYREPESLKVFQSIPKPAKSLLAKIARKLPDEMRGKSFLTRGTTPLRDRYIGNAKMFEEEEKVSLLKEFNENISYFDITHELFDEVSDYPLVHQMQYVDIHTWLRGDILLKAEKMSSAHELDVRMPFLDLEVYKLASGIPVDLKIANGTTKNILREAVRGIIPDHVLDRKKLGFPVPIRHWLKNELNSWAKQLISESETGDLLEKAEVMRLLNEHCTGKADYSRKIWTILMFMMWHQVFVEKRYSFEEGSLKQVLRAKQ